MDTRQTAGQVCCAGGCHPKATLTGLQEGSGRGSEAQSAAPAPSPTDPAARGRWRRRACREQVHTPLGTLLPSWPPGGHPHPTTHSPQLVLVIAQAHRQEGTAPELQQPAVQLLGHEVEPTEKTELVLAPGPQGWEAHAQRTAQGGGSQGSAGSFAGSLKDSASLRGAEGSLTRPMGVPSSGNRRLHYALNKTPRPFPDEGHKATRFPPFPPRQLQASGCVWLWRHLYPATPPSALSCRLRGFHVSGTPRYVCP